MRCVKNLFKGMGITLLFAMLTVTGFIGDYGMVYADDEHLVIGDTVVEINEENAVVTPDASVEETVFENVDESYVGKFDELSDPDYVWLSLTIADGTTLPRDSWTIDGLMKDDADGDGYADNAGSLVLQYQSMATLYEGSDDSDWYVTSLDYLDCDNLYLSDVLVGSSNGDGVLAKIKVDYENKLLYIAKEAFDSENQGSQRAQLLFIMTDGVNATYNQNTKVIINQTGVKGDVAVSGTITSDLFDSALQVQLAVDNKAKRSIKDYTIDSVYINGFVLSDDSYTYDTHTGVLATVIEPGMVETIEINMSNSISKDLSAMFGAKTQVVNGASGESANGIPIGNAWNIDMSQSTLPGIWKFSNLVKGDSFRITNSRWTYGGWCSIPNNNYYNDWVKGHHMIWGGEYLGRSITFGGGDLGYNQNVGDTKVNSKKYGIEPESQVEQIVRTIDGTFKDSDVDTVTERDYSNFYGYFDKVWVGSCTVTTTKGNTVTIPKLDYMRNRNTSVKWDGMSYDKFWNYSPYYFLNAEYDSSKYASPSEGVECMLYCAHVGVTLDYSYLVKGFESTSGYNQAITLGQWQDTSAILVRVVDVKDGQALISIVCPSTQTQAGVGTFIINTGFEATSSGTVDKSVTLNVTKKDKENQPVAGALFDFYVDDNRVASNLESDANGTVKYTYNAGTGEPVNSGTVKSTVSQEDAQTKADAERDALVDKIKEKSHTWSVVETKAPTGYKMNSDSTKSGTFTYGTKTQNAGKYTLTGSINTSITNDFSESCSILKVNGENIPISGAGFKLVDATTKGTVQTWTSSSSGAEVISGLKVNHTYTLTETSVPVGYITPETLTRDINTGSAGSTNSYAIANYQVLVEKKDFEGNRVEGAELRVLDESGTEVDSWTTDGTSAHAVKGLYEGKTYTLEEVRAPTGHVVAKSMTFTPEAKTVTLTMTDPRAFAFKQNSSGTLLKGAKMQVINSSGDVVDSWTTDETKHAISGLVYNETYTLQEIEAPNGYVIADDMEFTTGDKDIADKDIAIVMEDPEIIFSKEDANGDEVVGAEIVCIDKDTEEIVDSWTSTNEPHPISNLELHKTYILRETVAPDGFVYSQDFEFTTDEPKDAHYRLIDTVHFVSKTDTDGNLLKGAEFEIIDAETDEVVDTWVSGKQIIKLTAEQSETLQSGGVVEITKKEKKTVLVEDTSTSEGDTVAEGEQVDTSDDATDTTDEPKYIEEERAVTVTYRIRPRAIATDEEETSEGEDVTETEPVYTDFLCQRYDGEEYSYYEIDRRGYEMAHRVSNEIAGREYIVREVKAPEGYVRVLDVNVTTGDVFDILTTFVNRQVGFTKEDVTGEEVEGAEITVTDEEGNTVDKWISTSEEHYIKNLEEGHTYTLTETITPGGYTQATAMEFKVEKGTIDSHYKMVDTIHRVHKVDNDGNSVKGARLAVLDLDGNLIDEWVTGQHILDITEDMTKQAEENGGEYIIEESERSVTYDDYFKEEMYDNLDIAIQSVKEDIKLSLDDIKEPEETDEEDKQADGETDETGQVDDENLPIDKVSEGYIAMTTEDYVRAVFEVLPYSTEELEAVVTDIYAKVSEIPSLNDNEILDLRNEIRQFISEECDRYEEELTDEAQESVQIILMINDKSSGGYSLLYLQPNGTMNYVDIDEFGDEAQHRVSGLTEGERYVLRELEAPAMLQLAPDIEFVANSDHDITLRMLDMRKVARQATDVSDDTNSLAGLVVSVFILAGIGICEFIYHKSKNSFTTR